MNTLQELEAAYIKARSDARLAEFAYESAAEDCRAAKEREAFATERLKRRVSELIALTAAKLGV